MRSWKTRSTGSWGLHGKPPVGAVCVEEVCVGVVCAGAVRGGAVCVRVRQPEA